MRYLPVGDDTRSVDTRTAGQRGRKELHQVGAELTALTASLDAPLDCRQDEQGCFSSHTTYWQRLLYMIDAWLAQAAHGEAATCASVVAACVAW